jgi:hypothetical protein
VVELNFAAVDGTLVNLFEVKVPTSVTSAFDRPLLVPASAPEFVQKFTAQ